MSEGEIERLGVLYEVATKQQQEAQTAISALTELVEVAKRHLDSLILSESNARQALKEGAKEAQQSALDAQAGEVTGKAQKNATTSAAAFVTVCKKAMVDFEIMRKQAVSVSWKERAGIFFAGAFFAIFAILAWWSLMIINAS